MLCCGSTFSRCSPLTSLPIPTSIPQITTVDEASQFYPLFGLGANVALIFSGRAVKIFSQIRAELPPDVDGWGLSLRGLMGMVVIGGLLIAGEWQQPALHFFTLPWPNDTG